MLNLPSKQTLVGARLRLTLVVSMIVATGGSSACQDRGGHFASEPRPTDAQPDVQDPQSTEASPTSSASPSATKTQSSMPKDSSDLGTSSEEPSGEPSDDPEFGPMPSLPLVTGTCPTFEEGVLKFQPAGINRARRVQVYAPANPQEDRGPIVFFWHGMGAHPTQSLRSMGKTLRDLQEQGGWLIAPYPDPRALPVPWYAFFSKKEDDHLLADEIVACAISQKLIDPRRIHVLGMSAGSFQGGEMSFLRSNYVASSALYSGGFLEERDVPVRKGATDPVATMLLFGGEIDRVAHVTYRRTSDKYIKQLKVPKDRAILCNHRRGHTMPSSAHPGVWQFFVDHPYQVHPASYADKLPEPIADYCKLVVDNP